MEFVKMDVRALPKSPVAMINEDWALLTAGGETAFNTMTVSWGALGEIWGKDAAFVFVRPQRYTHEFMERQAYFTLSFLPEAHKDAHKICGSKSGRDVDKMQLTGLTPVFCEQGVYFEQAAYVIVCKKCAAQKLDPKGFIDPAIAQNYSNADFHTMYIGEIVEVLCQSHL